MRVGIRDECYFLGQLNKSEQDKNPLIPAHPRAFRPFSSDILHPSHDLLTPDAANPPVCPRRRVRVRKGRIYEANPFVQYRSHKHAVCRRTDVRRRRGANRSSRTRYCEQRRCKPDTNQRTHAGGVWNTEQLFYLRARGTRRKRCAGLDLQPVQRHPGPAGPA